MAPPSTRSKTKANSKPPDPAPNIQNQISSRTREKRSAADAEFSPPPVRSRTSSFSSPNLPEPRSSTANLNTPVTPTPQRILSSTNTQQNFQPLGRYTPSQPPSQPDNFSSTSTGVPFPGPGEEEDDDMDMGGTGDVNSVNSSFNQQYLQAFEKYISLAADALNDVNASISYSTTTPPPLPHRSGDFGR
ncbi:hypothetical protein FRC02_009718 [Tulasnella sp. 418]|nr:hypothetical protein FRC02_009718 [Tulasnella sp. 418]